MTVDAAPTTSMPSPRRLARLGPRGAFGLALLAAAQEDDRVLALTADLAVTAGLERFRLMCPGRLINVGIAEQNLVGIASAFAGDGWRPFAVTFANFAAMRSAEFVRHHLGYMQQPVTVVGIGAGFAMGQFGTSHYSLEDMAGLRAIPNISIVSPADATEVFEAVLALAISPRPCYLRIAGVPQMRPVDQSGTAFRLGRARVLSRGSDLTFVATGTMVAVAVSVAQSLNARGLSVGVVNMHTVKPIDVATLQNVVEGTERVVTVEEHSQVGGLGSAVVEYLAEAGVAIPLLRIGVPDRFPSVGSYEFVLDQLGLTASAVALRVADWTESTSRGMSAVATTSARHGSMLEQTVR